MSSFRRSRFHSFFPSQLSLSLSGNDNKCMCAYVTHGGQFTRLLFLLINTWIYTELGVRLYLPAFVLLAFPANSAQLIPACRQQWTLYSPTLKDSHALTSFKNFLSLFVCCVHLRAYFFPDMRYICCCCYWLRLCFNIMCAVLFSQLGGHTGFRYSREDFRERNDDFSRLLYSFAVNSRQVIW